MSVFIQVLKVLVCVAACVRLSNCNGWDTFNAPTIPETCNEIILSDEVPITFTSPGNYPVSYPDSYDGCWIIKSLKPDVKPKLKVINSAIEALVIMGCEAADFVEIRDGDNINGTLKMRWCGWGYPPDTFIPTTDSFYVLFHSDSSVSFGGFEMQAFLNESVLSLYTTTTTTTTQNPAMMSGETVRSTVPTTTVERIARRFNNDQNSMDLFNAQLEQSLLAQTALNSSSAGVIAGIVVAVLLGVAILGAIIHFATKACVTSSSSGQNLMNGDVIIPSRGAPHQFFDLGGGGPAPKPKRITEKYNLPGPEVSACDNNNLDASQNETQRGGQHHPQNQGHLSSHGENQGQNTTVPSAPAVIGGRTNQMYSQSHLTLGHPSQGRLPRSFTSQLQTTPRGLPPQTEQPQSHQSSLQYSRGLMNPAFQPNSLSRAPAIPSLQLPPDDDPSTIITPRLTARTMVTTGAADQAETHLAEVVDTDVYEAPPDDEERHQLSNPPPLLTLSPRLPPLLPPIRGGAIPPLDLGTLPDHGDVPPPPLYSSQDPAYDMGGSSSDNLPPPYDRLGLH